MGKDLYFQKEGDIRMNTRYPYESNLSWIYLPFEILSVMGGDGRILSTAT